MTVKTTPLSDSLRLHCQLLIQAHPLFSTLSARATYELAGLFGLKTYDKNEVIVNEDDVIDCIYFIATGKAEVKRSLGQLYETSVATLKAGDTIGLSDTGLYSSTFKRYATVTALTPVTTYCLLLETFKKWEPNP